MIIEWDEKGENNGSVFLRISNFISFLFVCCFLCSWEKRGLLSLSFYLFSLMALHFLHRTITTRQLLHATIWWQFCIYLVPSSIHYAEESEKKREERRRRRSAVTLKTSSKQTNNTRRDKRFEEEKTQFLKRWETKTHYEPSPKITQSQV